MDLNSDLGLRLEGLAEKHLLRKLRSVDSAQGITLSLDEKKVLNFSSNDYLGLAADPRLAEGAAAMLRRYGTGAGASRLISGNLEPARLLEEELARFKQTEAALVFSSGYAAAVGTIPALVAKGDVVILDKLAHACLIDGARLSGATVRVFPHNDLAYLEAILRQTERKTENRRVLIVTESIFSMDGDRAPLREIVDLKEKHDAWLLVDEAHATGLYGPAGSGLVDAENLHGRVEIEMGTLSKALGGSGGYIAGSRRLIDWLINRARSLIFSTASSPSVAGAALAALDLAQKEEGAERRRRLWKNVERLNGLLPSRLLVNPVVSPIFPIPCGREETAVAVAAELLSHGIFAPAIRYPSVARGRARLRVTVSAAHEAEHLQLLAQRLESLLP